MGLRDVERRIERGVEGAVGRLFRSSVNRIEVTKRLERELDAGAATGRLGTPTMPNVLLVGINPRDADRLEVPLVELERELVAHCRSHARDAGCGFDGPLVVRIGPTARVPVGTMEVTSRTETSVDGVPPGTLVLPGGERVDLTAGGGVAVHIGRDHDGDIVLSDDLASRRHARFRPSERGWILEDLESTNGTRVNGFRTRIQLLTDGDTITIGASTFTFDAS